MIAAAFVVLCRRVFGWAAARDRVDPQQPRAVVEREPLEGLAELAALSVELEQVERRLAAAGVVAAAADVARARRAVAFESAAFYDWPQSIQ